MPVILLIITMALIYYVANFKKLLHAKGKESYKNQTFFSVVIITFNILFLLLTTLVIWLSAAFSPLTGDEFFRHNALRFLYFSQNALLWVIFIEYRRTGIALYQKHFAVIGSSILLFFVFGLPLSAVVKAMILAGLIIVEMILYRLSIKEYVF